MEKMARCPKCQKMFIVEGRHSKAKQVSQRVTCPYCKEPNEVDWPEDASFSTVVAPYWLKDFDESKIRNYLKEKVRLMPEEQAERRCKELKKKIEVPWVPKGVGPNLQATVIPDEIQEYFLLRKRLGGC